MTVQTTLLATLIVILGVAQYALCVQAIHDLHRRPKVRGDNKVLWALAILCVPIGGAIVYNWMGPTSFIHRPVALTSGNRKAELEQPGSASPPATITSLTAVRSARRRRLAGAGQVTLPAPAARKRTTTSPISGKMGRTGS